jgi:hypothetical protein
VTRPANPQPREGHCFGERPSHAHRHPLENAGGKTLGAAGATHIDLDQPTGRNVADLFAGPHLPRAAIPVNISAPIRRTSPPGL